MDTAVVIATVISILGAVAIIYVAVRALQDETETYEAIRQGQEKRRTKDTFVPVGNGIEYTADDAGLLMLHYVDHPETESELAGESFVDMERITDEHPVLESTSDTTPTVQLFTPVNDTVLIRMDRELETIRENYVAPTPSPSPEPVRQDYSPSSHDSSYSSYSDSSSSSCDSGGSSCD